MRRSEQIAQRAGGYEWQNGEMNQSDEAYRFINGILAYVDELEERLITLEQKLGTNG